MNAVWHDGAIALPLNNKVSAERTIAPVSDRNFQALNTIVAVSRTIVAV
jgi:hypothetical protein